MKPKTDFLYALIPLPPKWRTNEMLRTAPKIRNGRSAKVRKLTENLLQNHAPLDTPVNMTVWARTQYPGDADSISVIMKAALDGIVDAGIIPDDSSEFVRTITMCPNETDHWDGVDLLFISMSSELVVDPDLSPED